MEKHTGGPEAIISKALSDTSSSSSLECFEVKVEVKVEVCGDN